MAGIKKINVVAGTGNPVQMQDLQNLWDAIASLTLNRSAGISIVSGFAVSGNQVGAGVMVFQGQAYYLPPGTLAIGQYLYAQTAATDQRVYENNSTHNFYSNYTINVSNSDTTTGIGVLVGQATQDNIDTWKAAGLSVPDNSITTEKLAPDAVTEDEIAPDAVTTEKIMNGNVTRQKLTGDSAGSLWFSRFTASFSVNKTTGAGTLLGVEHISGRNPNEVIDPSGVGFRIQTSGSSSAPWAAVTFSTLVFLDLTTFIIAVPKDTAYFTRKCHPQGFGYMNEDYSGSCSFLLDEDYDLSAENNTIAFDLVMYGSDVR